MKCTETLMQEHAVIKTYLRKVMKELSQAKVYDHNVFADFFSFFHEYADKFHHVKEERIYFLWMSSKNQMLQHGPLAVMLQEHEICRQSLKAAELALAQNNDSLCKRNLSEFCEMLYDHIIKEDNVLYQMAESLDRATGDGDSTMWPQFLQVQSELGETDRKWGQTPIDEQVLSESQEIIAQAGRPQQSSNHSCCGMCGSGATKPDTR